MVSHIVSWNTDLARGMWQRLLLSGLLYCVRRGRFACFVAGGLEGAPASEDRSLGWLLGRAASHAGCGLPRTPNSRSSQNHLPRTPVNSPSSGAPVVVVWHHTSKE